MEEIRVFIVDDHSIFRKGLKMQLSEVEGVSVVGEAGSGKEYLRMAGTAQPDLVFMDINMPEMNGIDATIASVAAYPNTKIVAISTHGDEEYLQQMLDAGAKGFLLKNVDEHDISMAIKNVMAGKNYFSPEMIELITSKYVEKPDPGTGNDMPKLSAREMEVLELIVQGYTNVEIAAKLFLSARTVDGHRANLLEKVGARNTVALVTYSIKHKIIKL